MESKARITLVLCCNATGDLRVPIAMIGSAINPRCFDIRPCSVFYKAQGNAWMDATVCTWWIVNVFLPYIKERNGGRRVALLWDNLSSHAVDSEIEKRMVDANVSIFYLPANTTSRLQPLDQGIIYSLKRDYRTRLLEHYVDAMTGDFLALRAEGKKQIPGKAGLKYGLEPHLLDVSDILLSEWSGFKAETIINCFRKSGILPSKHMETLSTLSSKDSTHSCAHERDVIKELSRRMAEINLSSSSLHSEISYWYDMDDDPTSLLEYSASLPKPTVVTSTTPATTTTDPIPAATSPTTPTETAESRQQKDDADMRSRLTMLKELKDCGLLSAASWDSACLRVLKEFGLVNGP